MSIPGSLKSVILRFRSSADTTAGWQALMFQGETFDEAVKIYRQTLRQINKARLNLGGSNIGFTGKVVEPEPNVTFVSSSFQLNTEDSFYKKFYADIEIVNTGFDSWEVRLNLHNKKEDIEKF